MDKDLNVRPETIKLLEENRGKKLSNINHSRVLYDPPPRILEIKAKIHLCLFCSLSSRVIQMYKTDFWTLRERERVG